MCLDGIAEIKGTLTRRGDLIEFTYRTTSLTRQVSDEQTVRIPLERLQDVGCRSNILATKILVYPKRLDIMEAMPGAHSDKIVFQVSS